MNAPTRQQNAPKAEPPICIQYRIGMVSGKTPAATSATSPTSHR